MCIRDRPTDGDLLRVAGAAGGDDGDVVEGIGASAALAQADLDLVGHTTKASGAPEWTTRAAASNRRSVPGGRVGADQAPQRRVMIGPSDQLRGLQGWAEGPLLGFDTETTGVSVANDRIVTAALVRRSVWAPDEVRTWLIDPGIEIPENASAIHGITTEHAREVGQPPATALAEIAHLRAESLAAGDPVVAYNASFDLTIRERRQAVPAELDLEDGQVEGRVV